jgi:ABC-type transport system involved in cytochrome c biogenesis permease subunit
VSGKTMHPHLTVDVAGAVTITDPRHLALVVLGGLALLGVLAVVRSTRKQAHEAARALHSSAAAVSLAGRSIVTGGLILGVQWLVITHAEVRSTAYWVALGLPAVLAGYTLVRACTVTTIVHRGGGRR